MTMMPQKRVDRLYKEEKNVLEGQKRKTAVGLLEIS